MFRRMFGWLLMGFALAALPLQAGELDAQLLAAAHQGDVAEASRLLEAGADVNKAHRPWNLTPLLVSVGVSEAMTDLLLRAGADINAKEREGVTVLMKAVHGGKPKVVERLLAEPGLMVDTSGPRGNTALTYAILYGHAEMVEMLVDHGADVNVARANGTTPKAIADHMHGLALAMPASQAGHEHHRHHGMRGHAMRSRDQAVASYSRVLATLDGSGAEHKPQQCHHDRAGQGGQHHH
ncbi:MAG: ankyrin repeat domain-containing protein [Gammaproteobacteria bacterium]|nr:ankyrin repeat domain-containing protein [Gammaproteobacteria bacterium]